MITTEVIQKLDLVNGVFTPLEARDAIGTLIDGKINFHKTHRISSWEGDNNSANEKMDTNRIQELLEEKVNLRRIYLEAKEMGKNIKIKGTLELEIID